MPVRISRTARRVFFPLLLAVFFGGYSQAADTSLFWLENGLNELVYQISRSIVTVESYAPVSTDPGRARDAGALQRLVSTGIIYDLQGHILVSSQAVEGRDRIVVLYENQELPAAIRGVDHQTGLAVIYINRKIGVPVTLGGTRGCAGQMVVAVGNVYGVRACPSLGFCAGYRPDGTIQFTGSVISGSVGGGLFDLTGNLVGFVVGGIGPSDRPEVGVAVPAPAVAKIARHLLIEGDRPVGFMGVTTADIELTPGIELTAPATRMAAAGSPPLPHVIDRGVMITALVPGSPAARAGLQTGDIIIGLDGIGLRSALDLRNQVRQTFPGSSVTIGFLRNNTLHQTSVQVGELPAGAAYPAATPPTATTRQQFLADSLQREIRLLKSKLLQVERQLQQLSR